MLKNEKELFNILIEPEYKRLQNELNIINSISIMESLKDESEKEESEYLLWGSIYSPVKMLLNQYENINSKIEFINTYLNEINNIKCVKKDIPDNVLPLLSPYGTFYDGCGILYCKQQLSTYEMLYCIINHISHYLSGMYIDNKNIEKIMQHFVRLNIVKVINEDYFEFEYFRFFQDIYKSGFKDIIIFNPCEEYNNWMFDIIKNNLFKRAIYINNGIFAITHIVENNCCKIEIKTLIDEYSHFNRYVQYGKLYITDVIYDTSKIPNKITNFLYSNNIEIR